ncbi:glycosyltransferase [Aequorivita sp. Q41]|uniref:glycosyltransferase family 2 protein n=1 Tax=Aequorivita sp. Q41 TaxID=3153300 RepID=UPI0032429D61
MDTLNTLPKLSVIVRTMGRDIELLKKAVNSIFENSYPSIEVIVVFQGTDSLIFEQVKNNLTAFFPKKKIVFIQNKTNEDERSKNLNLGMRSAQGEYLAFLDDDDFVASNHYENLISAIKNNNTVMAFCISQVVDETGKQKPGLFVGRYIDKVSFYKDNFITIHSFVVAKNTVKQLGLEFDERLQLAEDYLFLLPIYMNNSVSFVKERSCYYRIVSKESQSFTAYETSGKRDQQYKLLKKLKRRYKPSLFQKMVVKIKRMCGMVYKVTEN